MTTSIETPLAPLSLGKITVPTPVVLAPMAGITNTPFRRLCREYGKGIFVAEMVTSRALVERTEESMRIISHGPDETPRSVQLYGVEPKVVEKAAQMIVDENLADHIDLNFGCPVPKVTRKGGGAALPWKLDLFRDIVTRTVAAADKAGIPVTVKMRKGIDSDHLTYLDAGKIARDSGVAWVALHGRTAADYYSGTADWDSLARLKEELGDFQVLGNGDIWTADDAVRMVQQTGVDGVVVGRGCQGRPWLFADLTAAFEGKSIRVRPGLKEVADVVYRHAQLMVDYFGDELRGLRDLRKHMAWYFKGYVVGSAIRSQLSSIDELEQLREILNQLDMAQDYPGDAVEKPRGRAGKPKKPTLPEDWLTERTVNEAQHAELQRAELGVSGG